MSEQSSLWGVGPKQTLSQKCMAFSTSRVGLALFGTVLIATAIGIGVSSSTSGSNGGSGSITAMAILANGTINGQVKFTQLASGGPVTVTVLVNDGSGLRAGLHGFHIHANADLSNACIAAGPHFNPYSTVHGAQTNNITSRHAGDLGNVIVTASGGISQTISDSIISLLPGDNTSIIGRAVVLHNGTDDLNFPPNNTPLSNTTGNAGARSSCGIILSTLSTENSNLRG
jgi:Cu-Zn family superoxide dismutase